MLARIIRCVYGPWSVELLRHSISNPYLIELAFQAVCVDPDKFLRVYGTSESIANILNFFHL